LVSHIKHAKTLSHGLSKFAEAIFSSSVMRKDFFLTYSRM
jgi:hypothetical protein